ncbi:hypothetical protein H845_2443 [Komagataeibacter xylinus E25]|nr:hypothetical protein H845_2443 [Komagataeibacter xylinus E25]
MPYVAIGVGKVVPRKTSYRPDAFIAARAPDPPSIRIPPCCDCETGVGKLSGIVANEPGPFADMAGADISSTHHARFNGVAERLQRVEQPVRAASSEVSAVLKSEPAWAAFSDQADGFEVETRPRAVDAFAPGVGAADVLARRAARDKVGQETEIGNKSPCGEGADVVVEPDMGVVLRVEHTSPRDDLAGGDGDEASPVQAQCPAAGRPREQVQHTRRRIGHGDARGNGGCAS